MRAGLLAFLIVTALAGAARAEADLFSRDTVSGILDYRVGAAWGEKSWVDGGFGKTRFSGTGRGDKATVIGQIADADLVWTPSVEDFALVLDAQYQPSQARGVDLAQAYLQYNPAPTSPVRFIGKAGLYYPPISMEHSGYDGRAWTVANTITPSAINAWVGQELKVVGAEGEARADVADNQLGATVGVFGFDDTAGTLLSLRGWTLDDVTGTATGRLPLPPMNGFIKLHQASYTDSVRELDGRAGYYGRLDWKLPSRLAVNALYYDNLGDGRAADRLQWAWRTRFWNLGAKFDVDASTWLIGQAMVGNTRMGYPRGGRPWFDLDYSSAYLLASHVFGKSLVTGRIETFQTAQPPFSPAETYSETGWAATADYKVAVTRNLALLAEVLQVWSDRPSRILVGADPRQAQTTLQASARLTF